jgi:protein pelota
VLQVFAAVVRHIDWGIVKCLVIAGPGFAKDSFKTYLDAEAVKRDVRPLIENKASILTATVSPRTTRSARTGSSCADANHD